MLAGVGTIILCRNLESKTKRDCLLRFSSEGQCNDRSMSVIYLCNNIPGEISL